MGNMSYCRYQNTAPDFADCVEALQQMIYEGGKLSKEETNAFGNMLGSVGELIETIAKHTGMDHESILDNIGGDAKAFAKQILSTIPEPTDD